MKASTIAQSLTAADLKDNLHDIQKNVVAPILLRYGRHVFFEFTDGAKARSWLSTMFERVNARKEERGTRFTVNIGFTWEGLKALGLSQRSLDSFPEAFRAGMRGRARAVGDVGCHAPEHWEGGLGGPDIHAMAWIRTDSAEGREVAMQIIGNEMETSGGVQVRFVQDTMALAHENGIGSEGEHFGFADPISQPPILGADAPSYPGDGVLEPDGTWRPLAPGEFLLGYEDEAGAAGTRTPEPLELRLNGTYMVFRKLYQDVAAFGATRGRPPRRSTVPMSRSIRNGSQPNSWVVGAAGARSICPPRRTISRSQPTRSVATISRMQATRRACAARWARTSGAPPPARHRSGARPPCGVTG